MPSSRAMKKRTFGSNSCSIERPVPLMRLVSRTEYVVQFSDQIIHFGRCLDRSFDG